MADENIKMPQPDYDLQQRIAQDAVDVNPIDTSLPYQSIEDLIPDMRNEVSDEYDKSISMYKGLMDNISPATLANISAGANSSVINAAPSIPTELGSTSAFDEIWQTPLETTVELPNPIWANAKSINFDKYYPTDIFSDIGFTPYADMDKVYNQNETSGDFLTRFTPNFFSLFRSGRFANYRSLSDLFDGEGYTTAPDLEGAVSSFITMSSK